MDGASDHLIALGDEFGRQITRDRLRQTRRAESRQHVEKAAQIRCVLIRKGNAFQRRGLYRRQATHHKAGPTEEA